MTQCVCNNEVQYFSINLKSEKSSTEGFEILNSRDFVTTSKSIYPSNRFLCMCF